MMLELIHKWRAEHGFTFAILFGKSHIYASSRYATIANLFNGDEDKG